MKFNYSPHTQNPHEKNVQRIFEIIPGCASWCVLGAFLVLSFWKPLLAAGLIIAFDLYWLLRLFYMLIFLVVSYAHLARERSTNWMKRISQIQDSAVKLDDLYHLVIIPVMRESEEVISSSVESLIQGAFPGTRMIVVIALEERATALVRDAVYQVHTRLRHHFYDMLVVVHPDGRPHEARVKGANVSYAAAEAAHYIARRKIPFEQVIVSCFDADTIVSREYFSCLTYHFIQCPDRLRASFQPIPVYHNNIWKVPAFARILDVGASFFQLIEATDPNSLVTFSSHSMSFKALVEIGYWPLDLISDDSAIFWKALIHYDGDYRVVPLAVTVSMDIAQSSSWRRTFLNVYRQKRRWAWGVENFPIVMRAFLRARSISLAKRVQLGYKLFETHLSWATWPFLLGIGSWLPAIFARREFASTVMYYSVPRIRGIIFDLAFLALLTSSILSVALLPKSTSRFAAFKKVVHFFEWLLIPFISIVLSAMPALDAQSRLMLGRYMQFHVTEKRASSSRRDEGRS